MVCYGIEYIVYSRCPEIINRFSFTHKHQLFTLMGPNFLLLFHFSLSLFPRSVSLVRLWGRDKREQPKRSWKFPLFKRSSIDSKQFITMHLFKYTGFLVVSFGFPRGASRSDWFSYTFPHIELTMVWFVYHFKNNNTDSRKLNTFFFSSYDKTEHMTAIFGFFPYFLLYFLLSI